MDDDEALELLAVDRPARSRACDQLARIGFDTLGLQTYLTAGPKESRAWTIKKGATAPEAAGVIHTDFQRGFIKAEVVAFDDLVDGRLDARGQGRRQGRASRARTTSCRTATSWSSASTCDAAAPPGRAAVRPRCLHSVAWMTLHHVRRGSGSPLLLVHGLGAGWRSWAPIIDELAEQP